MNAKLNAFAISGDRRHEQSERRQRKRMLRFLASSQDNSRAFKNEGSICLAVVPTWWSPIFHRVLVISRHSPMINGEGGRRLVNGGQCHVLHRNQTTKGANEPIQLPTTRWRQSPASVALTSHAEVLTDWNATARP